MSKSPGQKIEENGYENLEGFERKQLPTFVKSYDEDLGIVEHFVAIIGNVDDGNDRIMPGAFVKSIGERGNRVKVLDMHSTDSVTRIVGKPLELREVSKNELTPEVLTYAPDATGALLAKTQYAIDTARGRDVFNLVKGGYAPESSIGYDALQKEHTKELGLDGKERLVRNLNQIRLWEYSNVVFGMNSATAVISAKSAPSEGKPYGVVEEDGQYCVYKLDADGKPMGKPLGKHPTEDEARTQMRALYVEEEDKATTRSEGDGQHPASHYLVVEDPEKPTTWHLRVRNASGELDHQGPNKQEAIAKLTRLYEQEGMTMPGKANDDLDEGKAGRVLNARIAKRIMDAMDNLHQCLMDAGLMEMPEDDTGPHKSDDPPTPNAKGAGPNEDDSTRYLKLIELELEEMEV